MSYELLGPLCWKTAVPITCGAGFLMSILHCGTPIGLQPWIWSGPPFRALKSASASSALAQNDPIPSPCSTPLSLQSGGAKRTWANHCKKRWFVYIWSDNRLLALHWEEISSMFKGAFTVSLLNECMYACQIVDGVCYHGSIIGLRANHTGRWASGTAIFEEFCGCIVALGARSWNCFSWTHDTFPSLSNLWRA